MHFGEIFLLALGLAMDATAVSASRGLIVPRVRGEHVAKVALFFGGFQALMPLVGWYVGSSIGKLVAAWDHWLAFLLLGFIGAKMLHEALESKEACKAEPGDPFRFRVMLMLAIATSIDALAAGITLPMVGAPLMLSLATIGMTTAVLSAVGLYAGRHFGRILEKRLDLLGGVVLIGLGIKILVEHLMA